MSNPFLYTKNPCSKFEAQQNVNYWWFESMGGCPPNAIEANWNTYIREMKREANKVLSYFFLTTPFDSYINNIRKGRNIMLHNLDFTGWENVTAWCVPTAISLLTGAPVGHMHSRAAFMQNKARKDVKGVFLEEAVLLLREQGYKAITIDMESRWATPPTIRKFLDDRNAYEMSMPVMFATNDHMMTAHYGFAADNWTKKPVPVSQFPKLNRKVVASWVVMEA